MIRDEQISRSLHTVHLKSDLVVVGGGLSGVCCAITAARQGLEVVLFQDRPVLGGNSSSEVRLWVLGATSHMGNNNRWAREGGMIDELLLENAHRNPEGNPVIFDTIILEKVLNEKNIKLYLNTAVYEAEKEAGDEIRQVKAFCSQNSTVYVAAAPVFCDASGDGILGFLAGASFRMGAESRDEFDEAMAPASEYGELLGHSLYFYSKDMGRPVKYVPPSFALKDISRIPRFKNFSAKEFGCKLWWIEYGGRLDTVHQSEEIKMELWKVVYGVWNYIKNSGAFPEAETMTLEWVGMIPGKRESRRFEGDYILTQHDIVEQRFFDDAVAYGGWSIDLHPADGVFSEKPGCNQWHSKGVYTIPYRCYFSRNIRNLFLAGRIISASHVAFGSSRVMATSALGGQAVGMAAALCKKYQLQPRELGNAHIKELQQQLLLTGHYIPGIRLADEELVSQASVEASSTLVLHEIPSSGISEALHYSAAQMLPVRKGAVPQISLTVSALTATNLQVELRVSSKPFNHTPDVTLAVKTFSLQQGKNDLVIDEDLRVENDCYLFICFIRNEQVLLEYSDKRITGIVSVFNKIKPEVSNYGKQEAPADTGMESFEFWVPVRRPKGYNIAMKIFPSLEPFSPEHLRNGLSRPVASTNAWVADCRDEQPVVTISWKQPVQLNKVCLMFDADYDNPLENVLIMQPERVMPFCVDEVELLNCSNQVVGMIRDNYLSCRTVEFEKPVYTQQLKIRLRNSRRESPVALFEVRCY
jgi:hypothetical protein